MAPPYELYDWPMIPGRAEIIRLVLEDAGVPYRDAFPNAFATHRPRIPQLMALTERVEARPNIAAYLASPRALAFNEHGIFRHYPELDP